MRVAAFLLLLRLPLGAHAPWDILSSRTVLTTDRGPNNAILAPNGDVFVAASPCNAPGLLKATSFYGTPAVCDMVIARIDSAGNTIFAIQLSGTPFSDTALLLDAQGNLTVGGETLFPSGFLATPGAYQASAPPSAGAGFACKLAAADGKPMFCTFLGPTAANLVLDSDGGLVFTGQSVIQKIDPAGSKLLFTSPSVTGTVHQILPAGDGTFYLSAGTAYGRLDPKSGSLFSQDFGSRASFSMAMQPSVGPVLAGNLGSGFEVRQYAPDGATVLYSQPLPYLSQGTLSVVNGGVAIIGLAPTASVPVLHNLHACGQNQVNFTRDQVMTRLDATGAVIQTTWLGAASLSPLTQTSSGWYALGTLAGSVQAYTPFSFSQVIGVGPSPAAQPMVIGCLADAVLGSEFSASPGLLANLTIENSAALGPFTETPDANGLFPATLAGITLTFDGLPAPLFSLNGQQLFTAVPFAVAGKTSQMCLTYPGMGPSCSTIQVNDVDPVLFKTVYNQDGTVNSAANPAAVGSFVTFFGTGFGVVSPPVADGMVLTTNLPQISAPLVVYFDTLQPNPTRIPPLPTAAQIIYAGPAPGEVAGLYQINAVVPSGVAGSVTVVVGGAGAYVNVYLSN